MSKARRVITAVVVERRPVAEVAIAYGVSRQWIYKLLARYRGEGEAAFEARSRRPYSQPTAIPAATVELIIQLRRQLAEQGLDAGPHTIAWHLAQQHHQLTVSVATIWRALKRAGLISPEPKKKPRSAYLRFEAEQPNQMWQTDFTHYRLTRTDGTPGADVEILCFIDDHSRYALSVTCHQPVTGPAVVAAFRQTVADQGIPASMLSDNGMVFTTRFAGGHTGRDTLNGFQAELRRLGVVQKHSKPNHPTTCGKVERFQQTLKKWLTAQPQQPTTVAELQTLCDTFVSYYNSCRPHRSLNRRTPAAAYQARPKASPPTTPDRQPQARVRRDIVDTDGKLSLRHHGRLHHIGVGRTHARTPILMLINGLDIRIIHATTGQIIRELILNPAVDYQAQGVRKPRPKPS
ncbi:MAG TPA: IS481 family transposase [Propionibacteriaceae bacterium]|nr:IS481 family transposase [Propionibacteriaceae bacterium]